MKSNDSGLTAGDIALTALFAAITAVCSWISIPATVPFTLQTFAVFLSVGVLGGRLGTLTMLVYLTAGAVGLPVFAGMRGGVSVLLGPTGGYIVGFFFSALFMWAVEKVFGRSFRTLSLSMIPALLICYAFGTAWFVIVYSRTSGNIGVASALMMCVVPYMIPDAIKMLLAGSLCRRLRPMLAEHLI